MWTTLYTLLNLLYTHLIATRNDVFRKSCTYHVNVTASTLSTTVETQQERLNFSRSRPRISDEGKGL